MEKDSDKRDSGVEVKLSIGGMTCQSCVRNIQGHVGGQKGIQNIQVVLEDSCGYVRYEPDVISQEEIIEIIEDMGFDAGIYSAEDSSKKDSSEALLTVEIKPSVKKADSPKKDLMFSIDMKAEDDDLDRCMLRVQGMTCASCVAAIEKHAKKIPGKEIVTIKCLT